MRSVTWKSLCNPRFTPQVPGPHSMFRLATPACVKTSGPTEGTPKAAGFQIWSPFFWLMLLLTTTGRKDGSALKSPTASSEVIPILPGSMEPQSSQVQKGVKPVPDFCEHVKGRLPSAYDRIRPAGHRGAVRATAADGQVVNAISNHAMARDIAVDSVVAIRLKLVVGDAAK